MASHKQNAWPIANTLDDVRGEGLRHRKGSHIYKLSLYTVALCVYKLMKLGRREYEEGNATVYLWNSEASFPCVQHSRYWVWTSNPINWEVQRRPEQYFSSIFFNWSSLLCIGGGRVRAGRREQEKVMKSTLFCCCWHWLLPHPPKSAKYARRVTSLSSMLVFLFVAGRGFAYVSNHGEWGEANSNDSKKPYSQKPWSILPFLHARLQLRVSRLVL